MDVLIVGAGVMGCAIGWRLAQAGVRVRVLERAIPGAEASSAAAGILAPLAEAAHDPVLRGMGEESLARYPDYAAELREITGIDTGFRVCGLLHAAFDEEGIAGHDRMLDALAGHRITRIKTGEARVRWPWLGPAARDVLWLPDQGTVDNREWTRALRVAAERAGAEFLTGYTAIRLVPGGVETDLGVVAGDPVVICAGAWTSKLGGEAEKLGIRPIRGQMLMVRPPAPVLDCVAFGAGRGYLVPRADGRVIVGSTMEDAGFDKSLTPAGLGHLARIVGDLAPSLSDAPVIETWAGLRPAPPGGLPVIGRAGPDGPFFASGHHRNGILLTPFTADMLTRMILKS